MELTGLDAVAYWLGYAVLITLSLAAVLAGFTAMLTMAAQPAWKTLIGVYDLHVLKWWMDKIKEFGRVIPTKNNVNSLLKKVADMPKDSSDPVLHDATKMIAPVGVEHTPPYKNCSFKLCDLPGQCRDEGKCHHPQPADLRKSLLAWAPDNCPITGRPFFMWIEHHESKKMVPTYGGPYDSYTIPARDCDGDLVCERYDHDQGQWLIDCVENVGLMLINDQSLVIPLEHPRYDEIQNLLTPSSPATPI